VGLTGRHASVSRAACSAPRQGGAASSRQQTEPVGEAIEDLLHGEDARPDRRELDRQREPIEPPAQVDDRRLVGGGQLERARRRRPFREERDRLVLPQPGERLGRPRGGQFEGRHRDYVLAGDRERFAAGGDHTDARRGSQHVGHGLSDRPEQMLAVVHDQQQLLVLQVREQQVQGLGCGLVTQVQRRHGRVAHECRVPDFSELDKPSAVAVATTEVCRGADRQTCLAHAARPDEADQAGLGELLPDLRNLAAAANEAGRLGWKVARAPGGPGHDGIYGAATGAGSVPHR
jgi:hypothetical protein